MSERLFIFRGGSREVILPVTPDEYKVDNGIRIEVINIHELGDVVLTGHGTLATIVIQCMLPANNYSFARDSDPDYYIRQFDKWVKEKSRLRFVIGDTDINYPIYIENFEYGEQDGTNDIYATITLREYRNLQGVQFQSQSKNKSRETVIKETKKDTPYIIQYGDTLSALCYKHYGSASADYYNRLAAYNGIKNPHLIYAGNSLKIPQPLP